MAADDLNAGTSFGVKVEGLKKAQAALRKAGADMSDMPDLMHEIGSLVVDDAVPEIPELTGRLKATLRAGRGKTKAVVRMGGARAKYAGVIEYGWPERGIPARSFLNEAREHERPAILDALNAGLTKILKANGLDTH
jgi:hypothetical protein